MTTPQPLELREAADGSLTLTGHASVFRNWYREGSFRERVMPGAFTKTLASSPSVSLLLNHGDLPLAHTRSGTLRLSQDDVGLAVEASLDSTDPDVQRLRPKMARGDLSEMSFAFRVLGESGQSWNNAMDERTLHAVDIDKGDVSVVTRAANAEAAATLRGECSPSTGKRPSRFRGCLGDRAKLGEARYPVERPRGRD